MAGSNTDDRPQRADEVLVRPAATVMLVRDAHPGVEVFMMKRTLSASFASGQYVFPGGRVDDADHADELEAICDGIDDAEASARLGLERGGIGWMVAAIRECFEEAGVLLARRANEDSFVRFEGDLATAMATARHQVHAGERSLADVCAEFDLRLVTDPIGFVSHWITPMGERRRFDTRFLLARAPEAQEPLHDGGETIDSLWVRPSDALQRCRDGDLQMFPPTIVNLEWLDAQPDADAALAAGEAMGVPSPILPRLRIDADGRMRGIAMPDDADYLDVPLPEFVLGSHR